MDSPANMYYFQMLILLLMMSVCTFWIGRMIQWLLLRKNLPRKKMFFTLLISLLISYLLSLLAWFYWPQLTEPMWYIFFLPTVLAEVIILILTILIFKKRKQI